MGGKGCNPLVIYQDTVQLFGDGEGWAFVRPSEQETIESNIKDAKIRQSASEF